MAHELHALWPTAHDNIEGLKHNLSDRRVRLSPASAKIYSEDFAAFLRGAVRGERANIANKLNRCMMGDGAELILSEAVNDIPRIVIGISITERPEEDLEG